DRGYARRTRRQRYPLVQLDELAQRRDRVRPAPGTLDLRAAALVAEDEQVRNAPVVEAERDAGVHGVQERALALDPEQLAAALAPLDDEALCGARDEVGHDRVDRDSPAGDHHPRLSRRDEDRPNTASPRLEVELARDRHLPDRAVGADGEDDRRVDRQVLAGRGREPGRRPAQVAQLDASLLGERAKLRVVAEEDMEAVLDVETVLDTCAEKLHPRRREVPALGHYPYER